MAGLKCVFSLCKVIEHTGLGPVTENLHPSAFVPVDYNAWDARRWPHNVQQVNGSSTRRRRIACMAGLKCVFSLCKVIEHTGLGPVTENLHPSAFVPVDYNAWDVRRWPHNVQQVNGSSTRRI